MDKNNETCDIFGVFCNYQNLLEYFNKFNDLLQQESNCDLESLGISKFLNYLKYLSNNKFFELSIENKKISEVNLMLIKIYESICLKYFGKNNVTNGIFKKPPVQIALLFDTVAMLHKIILTKCNRNIPYEPFFECITDYFNEYSHHASENFSDEVLDGEHLKQVLKFNVDILRSLGCNSATIQISYEVLNQFLNSFPFSIKYASNVFINHIAPNLFTICDCTRKKILLEFMWEKVCNSREISTKCAQPYHYMLLCCFVDSISREQIAVENFSIFNDDVWKLIQSGLISENAFHRKQTIYAFKILLFWMKTSFGALNVPPAHEMSLFSLCNISDFTIWNDLALLFETLEEKQAHIIKPLLPKFSRIVQFSSKPSTTPDQKFSLHPSWITCLIRRMIFHESKFITKQGLSTGMNIDFKNCLINQLHAEEFIQVILKGFNDQNMYSRINENDGVSLFLSSDKMVDFFNEFIAAFETELQKVHFLRFLLKSIARESCCGVGLLNVTFALTNLKSLPSWSNQDIPFLRNIIEVSLKTHESIMRSAIEKWLIKSCILFMDWNTLSFEDISELIFIFKGLKRHTKAWDETAFKLKDVFTNNSSKLSLYEAEQFALGCRAKILKIYNSDQHLTEADLHKMAKILVLLADSSAISTSTQENTLNWHHLLQPLSLVLNEAPKRPYMSEEVFFNVLQFYALLIEISQSSGKNTSDGHTLAILESLHPSIELIEFICQKSYMDLKKSEDIIRFQILHHALTVLSSTEHFYVLFLKLLPNFIANYVSLPQHLLSKKMLIVLFYSISSNQFDHFLQIDKLQSNPLKEINQSLLNKIISEQVIDDLSKSAFAYEEEKEAWQRLTTNSTNTFWHVTCCQAVTDESLLIALLQQAQNIFDGSSKFTYAFTIKCIKSLIPKLDSRYMHLITAFFGSALRACSELHGSEAYRPAINSFIEAVFQPCMLNVIYFDTLYKYLDVFQGQSESTLGIFYLVVKQFCNAFPLKSLHELNFNYTPFLIHSLTYGPIHQKGQRIVEDIVMHISERDKCFSSEFKNYNKPSMLVRAAVISYLLKSLDEKNSENEEITLNFIKGLLAFDKDTRTSKSFRFANSHSHRVRNRIWQAILILQCNLITIEESEKLYKKVLDLLQLEGQQPSIRYLQEWSVLKFLHSYECFIDYFIFVLEKAIDKRPGYLVSLLSILAHLIMHGFMTSASDFSRCFPILINYCMAQNFAVRLSARLAITELFLVCKKKNLSEILEKYDFLRETLFSKPSESATLEKGNIFKNFLKLQEDFYFAAFHPVNHFTLETIFHELPRLSNLASEEWIKPEFFKNMLEPDETCIAIPFLNPNGDLKNCAPSWWSDKSAEEPVVFGNESLDYNFQKKICPAKCEDYDIDFHVPNKQMKTGLIVVASLIDKIPNLGGLCRTCEVFGVSQFVIGSLKYVEDKQFQNLAVSADRWIPIKEVKPFHLKEYLRSLKEEGYTLVGAEQTDDSKKLTDYIFPTKSALVLGHEKEGMPVDLIQLLDVCVEIPQQGVIRSLNVHVSGALFIWEYARQQIKQHA